MTTGRARALLATAALALGAGASVPGMVALRPAPRGAEMASRAADDDAATSAAEDLERLAQSSWTAGEFSREREAARRALDLRERATPRDEAAIARDLHFLSEADRAEGDYGGALQIRERIGPMLARSLGPACSEMAVHLVRLAILREATGDTEGALASAEEAVSIRRKVLPAGDPELAAALNLVGHLKIDLRDAAGAEAPLREALSIWEAAPGSDAADTARALANLGYVLIERGDLGGARPYLERAAAIRGRALGPRHLLTARSLAALGDLERRAGNLARARSLLRQAIEIQEGAAAATHPELSASLLALALVGRAGGDDLEVLRVARRAEAISREHFLLSADGLSEREALGQARRRDGGIDLAIAAAASLADSGRLSGSDASGLLDTIVRSRALVFEILATRHRLLALHPDAEVARRAEILRRARGRLEHLMIDGPAPLPAETLPELLAGARATVDRAERALAERSQEFRRETARGRAGLEEVRAQMPPGSALVSYVRYEVPPSAPDRGEAPAYAAVVLRSDAEAPRLVRLGPAAEIDAAVDAWADQVSRDPALGSRDAAESSYDRAGTRLRALLWDPIAPRIAGLTEVLVAPDGALHRVSFAALPLPGRRYLIETGIRIHYVGAERDLAAPAASSAPAGSGPGSSGLLAVGDPDFDDGPAAPSLSRFDPLPGSRREAAEIAKRWDPPSEATLLVGDQAGEPAFKRLAPSFRVIHLATHAFLSGDAVRSDGAAASGNPLRLAGLALAGANRRGGSLRAAGQDDGILTAEEIALLDLSGVQWAVLSGCATGRGSLQEREGIVGLSRAFQIAGARTLILSLWPVEDEATRHWMGGLYRARRGGASTADSVRTAALDMIAGQRSLGATTHPFYWGAFVAVGDWR